MFNIAEKKWWFTFKMHNYKKCVEKKDLVLLFFLDYICFLLEFIMLLIFIPILIITGSMAFIYEFLFAGFEPKITFFRKELQSKIVGEYFNKKYFDKD